MMYNHFTFKEINKTMDKNIIRYAIKDVFKKTKIICPNCGTIQDYKNIKCSKCNQSLDGLKDNTLKIKNCIRVGIGIVFLSLSAVVAAIIINNSMRKGSTTDNTVYVENKTGSLADKTSEPMTTKKSDNETSPEVTKATTEASTTEQVTTETSIVHVINAQPINPYNLSLEQIKAFWSGKYDAVDIEGDMVSKIGIEIYPVRYAKCKEGCYGFIESHNTSSAEFDNGKYMEITHLTRFASQVVLQSLLVLLVMSIQKKYTYIRTLLLEEEKIYALTINEAQKAVMAIRNLYDRYNIVWNQYKNQVENFLNHVSYTIRYSLDKDFRETCNYLNANQFIQVNTDNLRNYSQQLGRISNRINNLDARIGNLKKEAVIMNPLYINRSVSVTSENYKIKKIISYLNDTASEFEMMEKEIQKTIS